MAKPQGGLKKWFGKGKGGDWVDIGAPKKDGKFQACGRAKTKGSKRKYPKCVPAATAAKMSKAEIKSATLDSNQSQSLKRNKWQEACYKKQIGM